MKKKLKVVGLVSNTPKPKTKFVEPVEPVLPAQPVQPVRPIQLTQPVFDEVIETLRVEVTQDDIYLKLKNKLIRKVVSSVVPKNNTVKLESSLKDTNLKDDIIFSIKTKKDFIDLWAPLDTERVRSFMNFCRSILSKNNLEFKIWNSIIETLKIYSFIQESEDEKVKVYNVSEDTLHEILCVRLYEEMMKTQTSNLSGEYVIIPQFKTYEYGKHIKELYTELVSIKKEIDTTNISTMALERKSVEVIKWLLFDSGVCIETLLENAFQNYLMAKIKDKNTNNQNNNTLKNRSLALGMLLYTKNSAINLYRSRSNMENVFMKNRIRRIRNILSRGESNLFHLKLEETIKKVIDSIRSNRNDIKFNEIKQLDVFNILIDIENGSRLNKYIKGEIK